MVVCTAMIFTAKRYSTQSAKEMAMAGVKSRGDKAQPKVSFSKASQDILNSSGVIAHVKHYQPGKHP